MAGTPAAFVDQEGHISPAGRKQAGFLMTQQSHHSRVDFRSVTEKGQLFATPWTAARQASLSFTISHSFLRFMSIEFMMLSNHLILCLPLLLLPSIFPSIRVFPMSQLFASGGQSTGTSALASVLPMNVQALFPLGLADLISMQSKGLSGVFFSTTV